MRARPKQIPKRLRDFALKHFISFGIVERGDGWYYAARTPGAPLKARYMTASPGPSDANGMAVMRRWLQDHKRNR